MKEFRVSSTEILNTDRILKNATSLPGNPRLINPSDDTDIGPYEVSSTTSLPNTKISTEPSSNTYRKIPDGVFVVCDDFLRKNIRRAASIHERHKACKDCEIRSKLRYAFWSNNGKQWEMIRPYPAGKVPANVAYKECRQFANNTPCLRTPCSFAHGQQELLMWTLEREGGKSDVLLAR